jgi:BirA family transcriptional regulator, biotin operon repressor / biotin---[acetyl-CoA-carboxylase] ligase
MIDAPRVESLRAEKKVRLGNPLHAVESTGSTSDDAFAAARAGAAHGATFVADEQTDGRGRRGSRWVARRGESLLFSVVLRPAIEPARASPLSLVVGLAIRDAVQPRIEDPVLVKWPNDIVVRGKKLAGILMESHVEGTKLASIIAGIGINVTSLELDPEIAETACSLALVGADDLDRESLLVDVLGQMDRRIDEYVSRGLTDMLLELRRHDALDGRRVRVGEIEGSACGLHEDGALLVRGFDGQLREARTGSVELLD